MPLSLGLPFMHAFDTSLTYLHWFFFMIIILPNCFSHPLNHIKCLFTSNSKPCIFLLGLDLYFQMPAGHLPLWIHSPLTKIFFNLHSLFLLEEIISPFTNFQSFVVVLEPHTFHIDRLLHCFCLISEQSSGLLPKGRKLLPSDFLSSALSSSYSILNTYGQLMFLKYIYDYVISNSKPMSVAFRFLINWGHIPHPPTFSPSQASLRVFIPKTVLLMKTVVSWFPTEKSKGNV